MNSFWLEFGVESRQGEAAVFLFMEGQQMNQHLKHAQVSVSKLIKENRLECLIKPLQCDVIKPGWSHSNSVVRLNCWVLRRSRIYSTLAPLLWAGAMIGASCLAGLCCSVAPMSNSKPYLKTMLCHSLYRGGEISNVPAGWRVARVFCLARRSQEWDCWEWRLTLLLFCSRMACSRNCQIIKTRGTIK